MKARDPYLRRARSLPTGLAMMGFLLGARSSRTRPTSLPPKWPHQHLVGQHHDDVAKWARTARDSRTIPSLKVGLGGSMS
jgi:hypothetical protein